jgi:hypothetical protein
VIAVAFSSFSLSRLRGEGRADIGAITLRCFNDGHTPQLRIHDKRSGILDHLLPARDDVCNGEAPRTNKKGG